MTYKEGFDTLGDRIADNLASDTYLGELWDALLIAAVLAIPMVLWFWGWK